MVKHRNGRCMCGASVRMTNVYGGEIGRFRWSGTCPNCGVFVTDNRRWRFRRYPDWLFSPVEITIVLVVLGLLLVVALAMG